VFKKISCLVLSVVVVIIIVSCGRSSNAPIQVDSSKKEIKLNYKYEKFDDYSNYKIYAEKPGFVLIKKYSGELVWTPVNKKLVKPLPKTNENGWCDLSVSGKNTIKVYSNPDISSKIIFYIDKRFIIQIIESMDYFVKIHTPAIGKVGYVFKKDLKDFTRYNIKKNLPLAKFIEDDNTIKIKVGNKERILKKGIVDTKELNRTPKLLNEKLSKYSFLVNKNNLSDYTDTVGNIAFYAKVLENIKTKNVPYKYYERVKLLFKDEDVVVIEKRFAFINYTNNNDFSLLALDHFGMIYYALGK